MTASSSVPQVETGTRAWDETPREAGRRDADYWLDREWPTEPDDPADHYNY